MIHHLWFWVVLAVPSLGLVAGVARYVWLRSYEPAHALTPQVADVAVMADVRGSMQLEDERALAEDDYWWRQRVMAAPFLGWDAPDGSYGVGKRQVERSIPDVGLPNDQREKQGRTLPPWLKNPPTTARPSMPDWREQTAADLSPAALDSGLGEFSPMTAPSPDPVSESDWTAPPVAKPWPEDMGASGRRGLVATAASVPPPAPSRLATTAERTYAGRLVETSDEWQRRLTAAAGPGWTYAGVAA